jgi:predicted amidohydrolase
MRQHDPDDKWKYSPCRAGVTILEVKMIVAAVQTSPVLGDPERNVSEALRTLAQIEADLLVLPELFNTGYAFGDAGRLLSLAETSDGKTISEISAVASSKRCWICGGFAEKASEGVYNSAFLTGPEGLVSVYRKTHLFGREKDLFLPGDTGFSVHEVGRVRVGMMICFDWIFPEAARSLALLGAEIILHPANLVLPYCPDAMVTRCLENRVFAITADRVGCDKGPDGPLHFMGRSQVVSPSGRVLCRATDSLEEVVVAEIEPKEACSKAVTGRNDLFSDRRPALYRT